MQNSANSYGMNHQIPNHHFGQPMQQDQFAYNHQNQQNPCVPNAQSQSGNSCFCPPGINHSNTIPCGNNYSPHNIIDQTRACLGNTSPIFILPNAQPIQSQQLLPQIVQNPASFGVSYPAMGSNSLYSSAPACYSFPMPIIPVCNSSNGHNLYQNRIQFDRNSSICDCSYRRNSNSEQIRNPATLHSQNISMEEHEAHRCCPGSDETICTKPNCPSSINLQALISQLLSLHGVIPCAATRLLLRKLSGSNVTTTVEDTMGKAQKSIGLLKKDQLINEARNAQQVNGLINLHMTANPPQNIIPILTMLQLKVNSLKGFVENLVNKSISECQDIGTERNNLEPMVLTMKSDADIRELLAILREKECEERVNVNYAPYHSQRVIAESRLANFQNKINQVETEMERRRMIAMPWNYSTGTMQGFYSPRSNETTSGRSFDSPDPFFVQVQNPKRLNIKPQPPYDQEQISSSAVKEEKKFFGDEDLSREKGGNTESLKETYCNPDKSISEDKKKLKIHIDSDGELSVKKKNLEELSPDVIIVIDDNSDQQKSKTREKNKKKLEKNKIVRIKSAESIPSDSTCDSEASVSSSKSCDDVEEQEEEARIDKVKGKSKLRKILKGNKNVNKESD